MFGQTRIRSAARIAPPHGVERHKSGSVNITWIRAQIRMNRSKHKTPTVAQATARQMMAKAWLIAVGVIFILAPGTVMACDVDSDCGPGGTCIKREKRARGVCYGGDLSGEATSPEPPAPEFFDPMSTPTERPADACFVTEECPAGMVCVKIGVWGSCKAL